MSSNIKLVDINNFSKTLQTFSIENNIDICDEDFILKMIKKGYCFINVSPSKIKYGLAESRIRMTNGNHKESVSIVNSWLIPCPLCEKVEKDEEEEYESE